ncbi:TRAP transporter permease [Oceanobacillus alkalisoli]|uniref:TRAP transporter permease n=1 Tax=Oceanobacillus alkalisoli TaxID=2925113 RepID=UPI001F120AB4|nr:TRAP transporter fused permease subunit [Oceanobacillus alkalisoli]MCF3944182.1 TRAP transporter fused permease subunit [Oceanobacillus alkalisoli]
MVNLKTRITGWFGYGYRRQLSSYHLHIFRLLACILAVYQIWSVIWGKLDPLNQMALHLSGILAIAFLLYGYSRKAHAGKTTENPTWIDYTAVLLVILAGIYFSLHAERIAVRIPIMDPLTTLDLFFGLVFILLAIEAARRTMGFPIIAILLVGFSYIFFGHYLPGIWQHREFSFIEVIHELAFSYNGLWGSPISVAATFVFMFLLFGAFLKQAGTGEFFFQLSTAIAGRTRGGAAKVAVLTSAFFGSISGSPTANVVATGSFTIPVSKKNGYKPSVAAGIEAVASTGGSILPPIMGSSAFLMAAVTQIPYGMIALAATIPAILYYVSLLLMVHLEAVRSDIPRPKAENIPDIKKVLKEGWFHFIPFIVLMYFLIQGYSASRTGFYAIIAIIVVSWFRRETRIGVKATFQALVDGARSSIPVTAACAVAGLIITAIMSTGLGGKLTSIVLGLTGGLFIPTLLLVMVICIVLGMGMPVAAAYILTAMLAAPTLIELGIQPMAAHLFIVYFSIFSAITPPVAVAAYAAAGIADENPNRVGLEAVKFGIVGFFIPFMFVLEPALLLEGSIGEIVLAVLTALLGITALTGAMIGWLVTNATALDRLLLLGGGCLFIFPGVIWNIAGLALVLVVFFMQKGSREQISPIHSIREAE